MAGSIPITTFSFADYRDPEHMHFGALRVLNDDRIAPTRGFGMHPHRDMEIVTYVLEGALAHRDSMGNGSIVRAGDVQRMSAGTGIVHNEYNASRDAPLHLLQIWLLPVEPGGRPGYQEARFTDADKRGRLRLVASPDGRDGAVTVRADASIYAGLVDGDERAGSRCRPGGARTCTSRAGAWWSTARCSRPATARGSPRSGASCSSAASARRCCCSISRDVARLGVTWPG